MSDSPKNAELPFGTAEGTKAEADFKPDPVTDAFRQLSLLRHEEGYTEVRHILQGETPKVVVEFYSGGLVGRAELIVRAHNDINLNGDWNTYVGRAPRTRRDSKATAIDQIYTHSFDIDAPRDIGNTASKAAIAFTYEKVRQFSTDLEVLHHIVFSGNGFQVIVPFSMPGIDIRGRRQWWSRACAAWEAELGDRDWEPARLDPQFDVPRIIKMVGTYSRKGGQKEYVHFVRQDSVNHLGTYNPELVLSHADATEDTVSERIENVAVPNKLWPHLERWPRLKAAYLGTAVFGEDSSGSVQDMSLVSQLKRLGYTPEEAKAVLRSSPGGKTHYREDYANLTIKKVYLGEG